MSESVMANFHPTSEYVTFDQLRDELRKKPDLVEVVRCRDCAKLNIIGECPCGFWALEDMKLDGFCAWGERK